MNNQTLHEGTHPHRPQRGTHRRALMIASAVVAMLSIVAWSTGQEVGSATTHPSSGGGASNGAPLVADGIGANGMLKMSVNKSTVVSTKQPYKRVSIGSADVADVNPIGPTTMLVTAKKAGSTQLIVWD